MRGGSYSKYSLDKFDINKLRGPLKRFYTEESGSEGERQISLRGVSPLGLPINEAKAIQRALRGLSLLSIAIMGVVRFAAGEPILNLFGA